MATYNYKAIDAKTNKAIEGQLDADNERAARDQIRNKGVIVTELEPVSVAQNRDVSVLLNQIPFIGRFFKPRVRLKDIVYFTQQLGTLIDAGIPLVEALIMLEQQTHNVLLRETVGKVKESVLGGDQLSRALSRHPAIFNKLYISLIKAGEVSGDLDKMCTRLNYLLEAIKALNDKLRSAMVYPAIVVVFIVGVVTVLMVWVVPVFKELYANANTTLPLPTLFVMGTSNFIIGYWWLVLALVAGSISWINWFRLGPGKPTVDEYILRVPLMGPVVRGIYVSRFIRTLGTVFGAGVSITEALVTAAGTVDNYILSNAFSKAGESIRSGGSLAKPLETSGVFPVMVTKMIAVGEETGNLERMLEKSSDFLDIEVDNAVETMTTMIEPILTVVMGGVVLIIALALYLPLFDLHKVIR